MTTDLPHLAGYIEQLGTPATTDAAIAERNAWVESAAQFSRNEDYYRGLLDQIAAHLGPDAFTADDGSIYDSPVRAKLPELVAARLAPPSLSVGAGSRSLSSGAADACRSADLSGEDVERHLAVMDQAVTDIVNHSSAYQGKRETAAVYNAASIALRAALQSPATEEAVAAERERCARIAGDCATNAMLPSVIASFGLSACEDAATMAKHIAAAIRTQEQEG